MKKIIYVLLICAMVVGGMFMSRQTVFADLCNSSACNWRPCTYTYDCTTNPLYPQTCETETLCCVIAGSCTCCDDSGGCYTNGCPIVNPNPDPDPDPSVPTSTPAPTPTSTPMPGPGTINAVARVVTTDTSCAAISSSATGIDGTEFSFSASSVSQPSPLTQAGNTPVSFSNLPIGSYSINYTLPTAEYTLATPCLYRNGTLIGYGQSGTLTSGATLEWRFGFTRGAPWVQTDGGNVYASGTLRSYVPNITPRVFNADSDGGSPGVVAYGTDYDLDSDWTSTGNTNVSSTNWLVNATQTRVNYYDYFYRKYGSPTTPTTDLAFSNLLAVTQPQSSVEPYYIVGDMTTSGDWVVGNGESIVIIVDGDVVIGGNVNITGNGFITFIVNGTITVSNAVGTTASSETPVVEGIYIAMKADQTGGFYTGTSISALTARFVGKGMFIADAFGLERDLDGYGVGNTGSAAELFIYNPRLLLTMPDEMKENSVTWQEVAP